MGTRSEGYWPLDGSLPTLLSEALEVSPYRTDTLQNMIRNKLVDGINTYGEVVLGRMCEDCIFEKHTSHPYNSTTVKERDVLECMDIDLWGLVQVQLAGGIYYFMAITDGFLSY